jgi:excisionase family DNA binding protein
MSENLLDGYVEVEPLAKQLKRHPRTVMRWMDQSGGLPFVKLGNRRLIHVETAKQWLFDRMKKSRSAKPRARKQR